MKLSVGVIQLFLKVRLEAATVDWGAGRLPAARSLAEAQIAPVAKEVNECCGHSGWAPRELRHIRLLGVTLSSLETDIASGSQMCLAL